MSAPDRYLVIKVPGWVIDELDQVRDVSERQGFGDSPRSEVIAALMHSAYCTNDWANPDVEQHVDDSFAGSVMRSYRLEKIERREN